MYQLTTNVIETLRLERTPVGMRRKLGEMPAYNQTFSETKLLNFSIFLETRTCKNVHCAYFFQTHVTYGQIITTILPEILRNFAS